MMHTRRRILIIKRGMSTFRIIDDIEVTDAPQKINLTPLNSVMKVFCCKLAWHYSRPGVYAPRYKTSLPFSKNLNCDCMN